MATIKSYTDISQSKKLAEILPLESADMYYSPVPVREWKDKEDKSKGTHIVFKDQIFALENLTNGQIGKGDTYAWNLAALLSVASTYCNRLEINLRTDKKYNVFAVKGDFVFRSFDEFPDGIDNLIDCCYEMILMLHKLNLL